MSRSWLTAAALVGLCACGPPVNPVPDTKVLVLGFDGMDPKFVRRHQAELPNLMRLAGEGGFVDLQTVMPPQSPVAWSTVITGMTPAGHGVFDFVHRDPKKVKPFSSMAKAVPGGYSLHVGDWVIPLSGGETIPLRQGKAFWEILNDHGIPNKMLKMPTDFPPLPASQGSISGMGTPDMLGSFGTFQFFTDDPDEFVVKEVSGGEIHRVKVEGNHVSAKISGPVNTFRKPIAPSKEPPRSTTDLEVDIDVENRTARLEIGGTVVVLQEGDWSDWVQAQFELLPLLKSASGIVRLYLKEVSPNFKLYVSPVNIDPSAPEVQISHPNEFAGEIAEAVGPFYTQGMAEETKALSAHLITRDEFIAQTNLVYDEEIAIYRHLLPKFEEGFLFYYFSSIDQSAHMLWGDFEDELVSFYERADEVVGWTLDTISDDTTLMVISDHGFQRFDREVHLNRWLMDEGFLVLDDPANVGDTPGFIHVDWSKTRAYAMGLNGLYINRAGREGQGVVNEAEVDDLKKQLTQRLLNFTDPDTDDNVVSRVYDPREVFTGEQWEFAPDLLVGFAPPYRMSPATGLGAVPSVAVDDNEDEWIGDHCMAHDTVPGVLFTNRSITAAKPSLHDVPVTVLSAFDLTAPGNMVGQNVLSTSQ